MVLILSFIPSLAGAAQLPASLNSGDKTLVLNGSGIRSKMMLELYQCAVYLPQKTSNHSEIIKADKPMAIRMVILSKLITPGEFTKTTQVAFDRSAGKQVQSIQPRINRMFKVFESGIKKGNVYDMVYVPGKGTQFYKNGQYVTVIEGLDFKQALFGTWLIENPTHGSASLRNGMLGLR